MYYAVTHLTLYEYSSAIINSVMELRMQPRSDQNQRCVRTSIEVSPDAKVFSHRDYLGNIVHHFDIPNSHNQLAIKSESVVEMKPPAVLPDSLPSDSWLALEPDVIDRDHYDMLLPGQFARETGLLNVFADEVNWQHDTVRQRGDPLSALRALNTQIYESFEYRQHVTRVDSPIDEALTVRSGVCQDFTHIMLTLVRRVGIPARYVSGYLYHHEGNADRSDVDASHAWVEAWLPTLGWVGFDPTNNLTVTDRHVRVSYAIDYAGATPSRGVFTGDAETELKVQVQVETLDEVPIEDRPISPEIVLPRYHYLSAEQQQQQQ